MCVQCGNGGCGGCGALTIPAGPIGPIGPIGPAGADGADGADGAPGPAWMSWSWSLGSDTQYVLAGGSAVFKIAAVLEYPGYNLIAVPTYVKIISRGLDPTADYDIQLYDTTNSQILASLSNLAYITPTISALAITPNNWPAGAAILAIRIQDNQAVNNRVGFSAMTWHD